MRLIVATITSAFALSLFACSNNSAGEEEALAWLIETPIKHYDDLALVQSAADAWEIGLNVRNGEDCDVRIHITDQFCSSALKYVERFGYICTINLQAKILGRFMPDSFDVNRMRGDVFVYNGYRDHVTRINLMHEIGHVLGFLHSGSARDLMFPIIQNIPGPSAAELGVANSVYTLSAGLPAGAASGRVAWIIRDLEICYAGSAFGGRQDHLF
jgi:hypothetical protein